MKITHNDSVIFFDVDDTLVVWTKIRKGDKAVLVTCPYTAEQYILKKHLAHIKILKDRKARGSYVVVWSAGGYKWAEAVIRALQLETYVDQIMSKPIAYVDDKPSKAFMGEHIYLGIDTDYGK
jgi:phosphoserine phosphatase